MIIINAGKISFCGITVALSVVAVYFASAMPTLKLALCTVASALVCVLVIKYTSKEALIAYLSTSAVVFILAPDKSIATAYFLFFGNYPVVKAKIENGKSIFVEWIIKIVLFSVYAVVAYSGCLMFFPSLLQFKHSLIVVFIGFLVFASIYDIALSLVITEIKRRFSSLLR